MITSTDPRPRFRRRFGTSRPGAETIPAMRSESDAAPIVVAVDNSRAAAAAVRAAVRLARELTAPLVFVYVRRGPSSALGGAALSASPRRRDARRAPRPGRRPRGRQASGRARQRRAAGGEPRPARGRLRPPARRAAGRARLAAPAPRAERLTRCHPRRGPPGPGPGPDSAGDGLSGRDARFTGRRPLTGQVD